MKRAFIDSSKCDHSPFCPVKRVCPMGAVTQKTKVFFQAEVPQVDETKCTGCGRCTSFCPHGAVTIKEVSGGAKVKKRA